MRKMMLATATALSMVAVPAMADPQDHHHHLTEAERSAYEAMTAGQRSVFDAFDADRKTIYFSWPADVQNYYWTLDEKRQDTWWYLTDEQRVSLFEMDEDARADRWNAYVAKVDAVQANGETFAYTTSTGTPDTQRAFVSQPMVQDISIAQHDGEYPVCRSDLDDHCINAWAAGMRGPNVDRPLDYWPGESVTEMRSGG